VSARIIIFSFEWFRRWNNNVLHQYLKLVLLFLFDFFEQLFIGVQRLFCVGVLLICSSVVITEGSLRTTKPGFILV
jgi:hypothetical protein